MSATVSAPITSRSLGDPARFLSLSDLEAAATTLAPPRDRGQLTLIVSRGPGGERRELDRVELTVSSGIPGDAWGRNPSASARTQLAVIQDDIASLIANGQALPLFGDNLYMALDLSAANLPPGSRLRAGTVTFEVTPKPHLGCKKYAARFGRDALAFISQPARRQQNLRGVYMCVVEAGVVTVGDTIQVISRG